MNTSAKFSAFIAMSLDGYIASSSGDLKWLEQAGDKTADMQGNDDMGFVNYLNNVDCLIMGRKTMEKIASFELTDEQWPYGNRPILMLSKTLNEVPSCLKARNIVIVSNIEHAIQEMADRNLLHAYVDGGIAINAFISQQLLKEITITIAPVLIGNGIPLFRNLTEQVILSQCKAASYPNGFCQVSYLLNYPSTQEHT